MMKFDHSWLIAEWERMGRPDVQRYSSTREGWELDEDPKFIVYFQYRIKSKPWINWDHVSDDVVAIARDKNGNSYTYTHTPRISPSLGNAVWFIGGSASTCSTEPFASFTPGTCAWQDSLVMRPSHKGSK